MPPHVVLLSVPGLRQQDLAHMPRLGQLTERGGQAALRPNFPAVTCPVQANMTTGRLPNEHGVVANGFFWRDRHEVEMWTAWNDCVRRPQIWDLLHARNPSLTSAVWFPLHSKGCGADFICTPAPVHNPDGSESLWCYTRPETLYGDLHDQIGHFPLQHFWGPSANITSSRWIADSAVVAAQRWQPNFFYIYLPHLDYAAQKLGPESDAACAALGELDEVIGTLVDGFSEAYDAPESIEWLVASEYTISPVDHVLYPNRMLREAGLLTVRHEDDSEHLDLVASRAWALVDHQLAHVFVRDRDPQIIARVAQRFANVEGVDQVLTGDDLVRYGLDHDRSGDVVLVSTPNSWQAYYWWLDDADAPGFARTVDIHRKPGYDPVEMHFDPASRCIPLDATLVRGSHGVPVLSGAGQGVLLASHAATLDHEEYLDVDVAGLVLDQFNGRSQ